MSDDFDFDAAEEQFDDQPQAAQAQNDMVQADLETELAQLTPEELKARLKASQEASGAMTREQVGVKQASQVIVWEAERAAIVAKQADLRARDTRGELSSKERMTLRQCNQRINALDARISSKRGSLRSKGLA